MDTDAWEFLGALMNHWTGLMGGVISLAVWIYLRITKKADIPDWTFWGVATACFLISAFLAWSDEHRALLGEKRKNDPLFQVVLHENTIGQLEFAPGTQRPGNPVVAQVITLTNLGAASATKDWRLWIT